MLVNPDEYCPDFEAELDRRLQQMINQPQKVVRLRTPEDIRKFLNGLRVRGTNRRSRSITQ